jgi:hypothetical protein
MVRFLLASCFLVVATAATQAAPPQKPISKPKFDPNAPQVEMFAAMQAGDIEVKLIPKNALGGNLLIANKGQEPITVQVPEAFVGVPINAQFGGGFGGGGQLGGAGGFGGGQLGGGGLGGGGQQAVGGGLGGGGLGGGGLGGGGFGGGGLGGGGGGFFSIPAERSIIVPYTSVCLEHGKAEPTPRGQYTVIPVNEYTPDPLLQQVIRLVGTGQLESGAAQAAAWNVGSRMSWNDLAAKTYNHLAQPDSPYFSRAQLQQAQSIVATAEHLARTAAENGQTPAAEGTVPRTVRTAR